MERRPLTTSPFRFGNRFDSLKDTLKSYRLDLSFFPPRNDVSFYWAIDAHSTNYLRLFKINFNSEWSLTHKGLRKSLALLIPMKGQFEVEIGNQAFVVEPEQLLLVPTRAPCRIRFLCDEKEHSLIAIDFSRTIVEKVAQEATDSPESCDLSHGGVVDETKGIGITLIMTIRSLIAGLGEHGTFHHKPTTLKLLSESILHLLYECMAQQPGVNREERSQDATPRHLKAAVGYIQDNLHRSLTVSEIATSVGISIRALQASFQRHLHTTPLRYLRQVRLEQAHRELSSPANRLPIGEVAHKWGFNHLGRFSSHYRALYGESPSTTVKRAQRSSETALAPEFDTPSPQPRQPSIEAAE